LSLTALEDRVTPSNSPWQASRPMAIDFFNATASDGQGNSVFVYNSLDTTSGVFNVDLQPTDAQGNRFGDPILVNTPSNGDHLCPAVAVAPDGRFVVTWYGDGPGGNGGCDIWARQFGADLSPLGPEFMVGQFLDNAYEVAPTVAIDPDGNFAIASTDQSAGNGTAHAYARFYSWDLQSQSGNVSLGQSVSSLGSKWPRLSIATTGSLVVSYAGVSQSAQPAYVQPFDYAPDGNGSFTVTAAASPIALGTNVQAVFPVAVPEGGFAAVVDSLSADLSTNRIDLEHFAADGSALDAAPIPVAAMTGTLWTNGAALDGDGNLWVAWHQGTSLGYTWNLMAERFDPSGVAQAGPVRLTPEGIYEGYDWADVAAVAVAPDGSLTAGWTAPDSTGNYSLVMGRHYDPIVSAQTETDTLTPASGSGSVSVVSQATTLGDSVLWEYWVTNNTTHSMGQFTISGQPQGVTGESNDLGWTANSTGVGWTASSSSQYLAAGATGYFTFTTPPAYQPRPTAAQSGGGTSTTTFSGSVSGPGPTVIETTILAWDAGAPDEQDVQVVSSATVFADHILWQYWMTNLDYIGSGANTHDGHDVGYFWVGGTGAAITGTSNDLGWLETDYGSAGGPVSWQSPEPDGPLLAPSGNGYFSFTTTPTGVGQVSATASEIDMKPPATGRVFGPDGKFVTLALDSNDIPIDAGNDNGSPYRMPEIPDVRDFQTSKVAPNGYHQLVRMTVNWTKGEGGGATLYVTASRAGGIVRFWNSNTKAGGQVAVPTTVGNNPGTNSGDIEVWVEGIEQSLAMSDVDITVTFVSKNGQYLERVDKVVTVTPIIISAVSSNPKTAGVPDQDITYLNGTDITQGLKAATSNGVPGFRIDAELYAGSQAIRFAQNELAEINGPRSGAGWTFSNGVTRDSLPTPGSGLTFPAMDNSPGGANPNDPTYQQDDLNGDVVPLATVNGGDVAHAMVDAPTTGYPLVAPGGLPLTPALTTSVDLKINFITYLVAQYVDHNNVQLPNYNNNQQTPWPRQSLFTLGYVTWSVDFYYRVLSTGPQILDRFGVTISNFVRSDIDIYNTNPPPAGGNTGWQ
jgi:hypothetical protein